MLYRVEWHADGVARIEAKSRQDALDKFNNMTIAEAVERSGDMACGPDIWGLEEIRDEVNDYCHECGERMFVQTNGVAHHGTIHEIDHDADAAHVAIPERGTV